MYVVGTAGHVDHGKSTLVQALTGIDPDRLQEEKARGMTIDLGFAWLKLPDGREVSLVDVPGHERFVRNMLAGVGGIDLALLVVAADEGVMPQTREHLAIIDLLGVRSGVVAITKIDLVDQEWLDLVTAEVEDVLKGTTLAGSPLVPCSAVSGDGLPALLAALQTRLDQTPPKRDVGRPRLWIDRAFTISGFGTVVTGTLIDGSLETGQEVELLPERQRVRVRGIQTHRQKTDRAVPGTRTALNLAGVSTDELRRGQLLTAPGWLQPTTAADARFTAVAGLARPIKHNARVSFHTGSAEIAAKVRLLDRSELAPGDSCWAQIRLAEPLPLVKGDAFVVRTPNDTIGGGAVVDSHPRRHRRHHAPTLAALELLERGSPEDAMLAALAKLEPCEERVLVHESGLSAAEASALIGGLVDSGRAVRLGDAGALWTMEGYRRILNDALALTRAYLREHPLRLGMPAEELKSRLGFKPRLFAELLARWQQEGEITETGAAVSLPGHSVSLDGGQEGAVTRFLADLRAAPFAPSNEHLPAADLLAYLNERGDVAIVGDGVVLSAEAFTEATARILDYLQQQPTITLAQVRDLLGTSRKYAQAILEHLDETRITRRVGDERVLRAPEPQRR